MDNQITVSAAALEQAAATLALMESLRGSPDLVRHAGAALSATGRAPRVFMHPDHARVLGEAGRGYTGNAVHRDFATFAQPTAGDVHVDAILTSLSVKYRNPEFIGPLAVPRVQVSKRSDKFFVFDTANLRNDAQVRAPATTSARGGYNLTTDNYSVVDYAIEHAVPDEIRANADSPLDMDRDGAEFVADVLDMKYEKQVASLINTSGNWTTNATLSGTSQWSDFTNSDPVADIETAIRTVLKQIARRPNTLILGYEVFEKLAQHPDLLDRVKYTGTGERPAMVTAQMLAELFRLEQVLIGSAIENTAVEGQTDAFSFVWAKHAWLGFTPGAPAINRPAAAYVFTTGRMLDRYREEQIKSDIIRGIEAWDTEVVSAGGGYRIINAVA